MLVNHRKILCMKAHFLIQKELNQNMHIIKRMFGNSFFTKDSNLTQVSRNSLF